MMNGAILFIIAALLQFQQGRTEQRFVPNVPEECQRLGYCNLPQPDYPEEHVERLIQTLGLQNVNQSVVDSIQPNLGWDPQEVELCTYVEQELIPLVAQDGNGTWNFILNSNHYRQTYRVQICEKTGIQCSSIARFFEDYHATCEQNFIKKILKAIDQKGNIIEMERLIPSNCYCKVIQGNGNRNNEIKSLQDRNNSKNQNPEDEENLHSNILGKKYHQDNKSGRGRS